MVHRSISSAAVSTPASESSVPPTVQGGSHKRKRQESSIDEIDEALLSRLEKVQQQQDGEASFGEHIAACLREMNPRQRAIARIEIDKLLMNIQ